MPPATASHGAGPLGRRLRHAARGPRGTAFLDQVLSSVSNLLAVVLVARALSAADFGRFALGYAFLTVALNLSRAYFGTRVALATDPFAARETASGVVAALALIGPLLAVLVLGVSTTAASGRSVGVLSVVAVCTPIVCIQDILRFGAVASGRPASAVWSDATWVVIMAVPIVLGLDLSATAVMAVWGAAAGVALLIAAAGTRCRPRIQGGLAELARNDRVGGATMVGTLVTNAATLVVLVVVARTISQSAAGSLRGASSTMGPVNVLIAYSALSLTPALARRGRSAALAFCAAGGGIMVVLCLAWGVMLLSIPAGWGRDAFGASWPGIRHVLPFTVTEYGFLCLAAAAVVGLKVGQLSRPLVVQRTTAATVTVVGGTVASVALGHTADVAATLAVAAAVAAGIGWLSLWRRRAGDEVGAAGPLTLIGSA